MIDCISIDALGRLSIAEKVSRVESSKGTTAGKVLLCRDKIRSLRQLNGLSQEGLSHALYDANCQVSIATVKRIETGKPVSFRIAGQMAKFFGASVEELLDDRHSAGVEQGASSPSVWLYVIFATPVVIGAPELDVSAWLHEAGLSVQDKVGGYYIGYDTCSSVLERLHQRLRMTQHGYPDVHVKLALKQSHLVSGPSHSDPIDKSDLDELVSVVQLLGYHGWMVDDAALLALPFCCVAERLALPVSNGYWMLTPQQSVASQLIGRDTLRATLLASLSQQEPKATPRVPCVLVQGDRGVGKSHVLQAMITLLPRALSERCLDVRGRPSEGVSLSALARLLLAALALPMWASPSDKQVKAHQLGLTATDTERLLVLLASEPHPKTARLKLRLATTDPKLVQLVLAQTQVRLLVLDDAQCVDGDSWQVIHRALTLMADPPICLMSSDRPLVWPSSERWAVSEQKLMPLSTDEVRRLAHRWAPEALSGERVMHCVEICGGNPAFLRQLLLEAPLSSEMTTQSYSFIDQQVDRLTVEQKRVLWAAVACGLNVDREVITALFPQGQDALEGLCQNSLLRQRSTHTYAFYHTAVYDYLQRHITPPVWKDINSQLTQVLKPMLAQPGAPSHWQETYAHCLAQQGESAKAFECYIHLARRHKDRGELPQAITALEWAETAMNAAYSLRREIDWLLLMGTLYKSHYGWSSPQQKRVFDQLQRVCVKSAQQGSLGSVFFHQWLEKLMALKLDDAGRLALTIKKHGETVGDTCIEVHGLAALANTHFWSGDHEASLHCAQRALDLHQHADTQRDLVEFGQDPRVVATLFLVLSHSLRGEWTQADTQLSAMSELVSQSDNVFSQAIGAQAALFYYYHADEAPEVELRAEALLQLAQNLDLPFFIGIAKVFLGWSLGRQGQLELGLALLADGYHHWLAKSGHRMGHSLHCCMAAELMLRSVQPHRARALLQTGIPFMRAHQELCYLDKAERFEVLTRDALNIR
ncbi:XRE family transcriptional regulator [Vibrio coralliilyticus]|uniref:XRE family transcriptional regulator n=1 Tax=Vibrio coralliilyticus TaxID=190893 RepID=UPI001F604574|nr:XRE family transcriptional regulator [Vibrio coralliilyticus]